MLASLLRPLIAGLFSRLPFRSGKPSPKRTYRIVREPAECFELQAPADGPDYKLVFMDPLARDPSTPPPDGPQFPLRVGRADGGCVLGLSFLASSPRFATCLNFLTHNPRNPDKVSIFEEPRRTQIVDAATMRTSFDDVDSYAAGVLIGDHENFGHWLMNHLARLALVESVPSARGVPLIIGENASTSRLQCLERMGYREENLIRLRKGRLAHFERLWVPMMPFCSIDARLFWSPPAVDFLRERLGVRTVAPERGRRLYLSRRNSRWRRLQNESEILARLEPWGFEVIAPETLSIAEQIELAGEAEAIVGAFGAGMIILLFAPAETRIFEMKYESGPNMDIHRVLSPHIGQHYIRVPGTPIVDESITNTLNYDFTVEPGVLEGALESAGIRPR